MAWRGIQEETDPNALQACHVTGNGIVTPRNSKGARHKTASPHALCFKKPFHGLRTKKRFALLGKPKSISKV